MVFPGHLGWPPSLLFSADPPGVVQSHSVLALFSEHRVSYSSIPILTGHLEDVGDSLVLEQARVRHHTGKWLPIHASARHHVEL